jgi:hypothetical protein
MTDMKTKGTETKPKRKRDWLDDLWDWEAKHPIAFASPTALADARIIAALEKSLRRRRLRRNGATSSSRRRKVAAA